MKRLKLFELKKKRDLKKVSDHIILCGFAKEAQLHYVLFIVFGGKLLNENLTRNLKTVSRYQNTSTS